MLRSHVLSSFLAALLAAGLAATALAPAALAQEPEGVSREAIAEVLKVLKFPVTYMTSEAGSPTIETRFGDIATTLQFGDCEGAPPVCKDLAFIATFDEVEVPALADIVARNENWNFVKITLDPGAGVPGAEMDLTMISGDPQIRLAAAIDIWRSLAEGLADGFPMSPPPSVLSNKVLDSAMTASPAMASALFAPDPDIPASRQLQIVNAETLAAMLKELGYETTPANDDGTMMWVDVDGVKSIASPRVCNRKQNHCGLLSLVHIRDPRRNETMEKINDFNISEWFVRAFRVDTGQTLFSFDAPVFDGLSRDDLERYLSIWAGTVSAYDSYIDAEE